MLRCSNQNGSGWYFLQPLWAMRGCLELRGRQRVPRFWFLGVLLPVGPEELHSGGYLGGALLFSVGGNGWEIFGHLFQDALICCSCGVMKYCRNADKLMTWKTSFHNENVRVWRPAWWLGRVLWFFFHWLWRCWNLELSSAVFYGTLYTWQNKSGQCLCYLLVQHVTPWNWRATFKICTEIGI